MPNEKFYRRIMYGEEANEPMKTSEFEQRFPKPWKFVMNDITFTLVAANGQKVALLSLASNHSGVPQREWNRHVAAALREFLPVEEEGGGMAHRPQNMNPPSNPLGRAARASAAPVELP